MDNNDIKKDFTKIRDLHRESLAHKIKMELLVKNVLKTTRISSLEDLSFGKKTQNSFK